jgi:hypothetical protein
MRMIAIVLLTLSLFTAVFREQPSVAAVADCAATPTSLADPLTAGVWNEIMGRRAALGLPAFTWSPVLAQGAAWMAADIAAHQPDAVPPAETDSLGRSLATRTIDCGDSAVWETAMYVYQTDPFGVVSIWYGNDTFRMWQVLHAGSPGYPTYSHAALGYAQANGRWYWVMDLGSGVQLSPGGAQATPVPTATPVPFVPTATPVPFIPTPTPTNPPLADWTWCADEGGYCGYDLERQVRYGANGVYAYRTQSGGVACTNAVFGDPLEGVFKSCAYGPAIVIQPPPPPPTATPIPTATHTAKCQPSWRCGR